MSGGKAGNIGGTSTSNAAANGAAGRVIIADNTVGSGATSNVSAGSTTFIRNGGASSEGIIGPSAVNPVYSDRSASPMIAGLARGAAVAGYLVDASGALVDGTKLDVSKASGIQSAATKTIGASDMLAVLRYDNFAALKAAQPNIDLALAQDYSGYDVLVVANLTDTALANPRIAIGDTALRDLRVGGRGISASATVNERGYSDSLVTSLAAGAVWVTLIPEAVTQIKATVDIAGRTLGLNGSTAAVALPDGDIGIVRNSQPSLTQGLSATGFQFATYANTGGAESKGVIYALQQSSGSNEGVLAVLNASDLSVVQIVSAGRNAFSMTVTDTEVKVINAQGVASSSTVRTFARGAGGVLTETGSGQNTGNVSPVQSETGNAGVYRAGSFWYFHLNGSNRAFADTPGLTGPNLSGVAAASIGTTGYILTTNGTSGLLVSGPLTPSDSRTRSVTIDGLVTGSIKVFDSKIYVTNQQNRSVQVFSADLTLLQTLSPGTSGARGLDVPNDIAFTPDGKYAIVINADNTMGVFARNANGTLEPRAVQIVREGSGGAVGLTGMRDVTFGPVVNNQVTMYVATEGGNGALGGISRFVVDLAATPNVIEQTIVHTNVEDLTVQTGTGVDRIVYDQAAPASVRSVTIKTGLGNDTVTVSDVNAGTTRIDLGEGSDTAVVAIDDANATVIVAGGKGNDSLALISSGANSRTSLLGDDGEDTVSVQGIGAGAQLTIDGGSGSDTITLRGHGLPSGTTTTIAGGTNATGSLKDRLGFDAGSATATVSPAPLPSTADRSHSGMARPRLEASATRASRSISRSLRQPFASMPGPSWQAKASRSASQVQSSPAAARMRWPAPWPLIWMVTANMTMPLCRRWLMAHSR